MKVKFIDEFRSFVSRGNVVDMAVGIIIGAAFGKIVTSFVSDIIMPPIGWLIGGVNFTSLQIAIGNEVTIKYGQFIQTLFDFTITAFAIFIVIKAMNKLNEIKLNKLADQANEDAKKEEVTEIPMSKEESLLTEIRDLLKDRK